MRQLKINQSITSRESESLEKYLSEISKIELVTPEEEAELAKRIRAGDEEALEKLTKANLRFVVSVAKQYQGQGLSLPDLINEGNVGLMKAARRFDETKGFKFISYAVWWIRQSILLAIMEQARLVRMPLNKVGSYHKINKLSQQLEQEYEREPTLEELAEIMHMKEEEIRDLSRGHHRHVSMDAPVGGDAEDGTLLDLMPAGAESTDPDSSLLSDSLKQEISEVLAVLNFREKDIIAAYYGLNGKPAMSLEEISEELSLTRERVRQIKERAIRRLRRATTNHELKSYL